MRLVVRHWKSSRASSSRSCCDLSDVAHLRRGRRDALRPLGGGDLVLIADPALRVPWRLARLGAGRGGAREPPGAGVVNLLQLVALLL
ncbi:hypothetical protein HBB16_17475 [Pseudonocardia sp. MCCB 268]|nr:hypothetical protein [Pseudonocardia cytotoxica]